MAWFAAAMPYITAGVSAAQTIAQGNVQEQMADIEARQQREQALADQAEAVQTANQERKRAKYLQSRARAVGAASGTSMDSPNIVDAISDIGEQGEYNALSALYSGNTSARSRNYAAQIAKTRGKRAKTGSYYNAGGTVLEGYDTLATQKGWYS